MDTPYRYPSPPPFRSRWDEYLHTPLPTANASTQAIPSKLAHERPKPSAQNSYPQAGKQLDLDTPLSPDPPLVASTSKEMEASNEGTKVFHRFPKLPLELRRRIWRFTPPLFPRVIEVRARTTDQAWDPLTTRHHVVVSGPLVLLSINYEARQELLQFYTTLSSNVTLNPITNPGTTSQDISTEPPRVNLGVDTIYFKSQWNSNEDIPYLSFVQRLFEDFERDRLLVRKLAVPYNSDMFTLGMLPFIDPFIDDYKSVPKYVIFQFNGLEKVAIICKQRYLQALSSIDLWDGVEQKHAYLREITSLIKFPQSGNGERQLLRTVPDIYYL